MRFYGVCSIWNTCILLTLSVFTFSAIDATVDLGLVYRKCLGSSLSWLPDHDSDSELLLGKRIFETLPVELIESSGYFITSGELIKRHFDVSPVCRWKYSWSHGIFRDYISPSEIKQHELQHTKSTYRSLVEDLFRYLEISHHFARMWLISSYTFLFEIILQKLTCLFVCWHFLCARGTSIWVVNYKTMKSTILTINISVHWRRIFPL